MSQIGSVKSSNSNRYMLKMLTLTDASKVQLPDGKSSRSLSLASIKIYLHSYFLESTWVKVFQFFVTNSQKFITHSRLDNNSDASKVQLPDGNLSRSISHSFLPDSPNTAISRQQMLDSSPKISKASSKLALISRR